MAVTITETPQKYTPSGNPVIFRFTSDLTNVTYFNVRVYQNSTDKLLASLKAYIKPTDTNAASIDIYRILNDLTSTQIVNNDSVYSPVGGSISYYVKVSENTNASVFATSSVFVAFNGGLSDFQFYGYAYNDYVVSTTKGKFLTFRPDAVNLTDGQFEHLYFLTDGSAVNKVVVETFNRSGTKTTYSTDIVLSGVLHRLNLSPASLISSMSINWTGIVRYRVVLMSGAVVKSNYMNYNCLALSSDQNPVVLIWSNKAGGLDSYTFINPKETKNVAKTTLSKNGAFAAAGNVATAKTKTITVKQESNYSLVTPVLNDIEYQYISDVVGASEVFVRLNNGLLLPVEVQETSIPLQYQRYDRQSNRMRISFKADSNLTFTASSYNIFNGGFNAIGYTFTGSIIPQTPAYEKIIGNGSNSVFDVVHGLGTLNVAVDLVEVSTGETIFADVTRINVSTVKIEFGYAIPSNSVRVLVSKL